MIDGAILDNNQTSWLSSSASLDKPGTYYVRVQAYQCDFGAGPEWSATATIVKAVPPPPPPPPAPNVNLAIKAEGYNGYDTTGVATRLKVGKRYWITLTVKPPTTQGILDILNLGNTKLCVAKKRGKLCGEMFFYPLTWDNIIVRIAPSMVVAGKVTVFAEYNGKRLASKRYGLAR
ncbi:MAG: hypothetical protein H0U46_08145 [Actinobacteria bacterium]|nr:hypothetical protein [Actinomycetota bacterium]